MILSATLLVAIASTVGLAATAFAQMDNNATMTETTTPASSSSASKMMGVIASIQRDENGNPAWITAGHWTLDSDVPLVGSGASSS